jgi:hypothetical protein
MAKYPDDLYPFSAAYLIAALPQLHERVIIDPSAPSSVRVFGKSMHVLAAGWVLAIGWLWLDALQQHQFRTGVPFDLLGAVSGLLPALVLGAIGWTFARVAGRAPYVELQRREWWHACWWSLVPVAMLLVTVWLIVQEAQ